MVAYEDVCWKDVVVDFLAELEGELEEAALFISLFAVQSVSLCSRSSSEHSSRLDLSCSGEPQR